MSFEWITAIVGSLIAGLVQGVVGFAFGLVALSFFAFVLEPVPGVIVVTGLAFAFTLVGLLKLYREVEARALQAFFVVNQGLILLGYGSAGLLTRNIALTTFLLGLPALVGFIVGWTLFGRVSEPRFRRIVLALLLIAGLTLGIRG